MNGHGCLAPLCHIVYGTQTAHGTLTITPALLLFVAIGWASWWLGGIVARWWCGR